MRYNTQLIIGIICLVGVACGTTARLFPDEKNLLVYQNKVPGITYEQMKQGASLYTKTCGGCHKLHEPSEYTVEGWSKNLREMFPKAHVEKEDQQTLIRNYLFALSK